MLNIDDEPRIVQLTPAVGWRVLYAEDDGTGYYSDLVGWILLDNGNIEPIDCDQTGCIGYFLAESVNFVGLFGPSVVHTEAETLQLVAEWKARQKKTA